MYLQQKAKQQRLHSGTEVTTHIFHDEGPESVMWAKLM